MNQASFHSYLKNYANVVNGHRCVLVILSDRNYPSAYNNHQCSRTAGVNRHHKSDSNSNLNTSKTTKCSKKSTYTIYLTSVGMQWLIWRFCEASLRRRNPKLNHRSNAASAQKSPRHILDSALTLMKSYPKSRNWIL
jgi:hypothetical protein